MQPSRSRVSGTVWGCCGMWKSCTPAIAIHTRGFAQGACSGVILHDTGENSVGACSILWHTQGSVFNLFNLSGDLIPKYLTSLIMLWSILQGGNSAPENELCPWNHWYTWMSFAPRACTWSKTPHVYQPLLVEHFSTVHVVKPKQTV